AGRRARAPVPSCRLPPPRPDSPRSPDCCATRRRGLGCLPPRGFASCRHAREAVGLSRDAGGALERQLDDEPYAARARGERGALPVLRPGAPAVQRHQLSHHREPDAGSGDARAPVSLAPPEAVPYALAVGRGAAGPRLVDPESRALVARRG